MIQLASSGNTYNVNTNYIGVQCRFTGAIGYTYLWVDGSFTGKDVELDFSQNGTTYFKTILVENLAPGTHKIEIKASMPTGVDVKSDFIYVTIPTK
jgi:hypothetical protein